MKLIISALLMTFSSLAIAGPIFEKNRVTVIVQKSELKMVNGRYQSTVNEVCRGKADLDVYDFRNANPNDTEFRPSLIAKCESSHDGKKLYLQVGAFVLLDRRVIMDVESEIKSYGSFIDILNADSSPLTIPVTPDAYVMTKNLNNKSLILSLSPSQYLKCPPGTPNTDPSQCKPINPTIYSATVQFETL